MVLTPAAVTLAVWIPVDRFVSPAGIALAAGYQFGQRCIFRADSDAASLTCPPKRDLVTEGDQ